MLPATPISEEAELEVHKPMGRSSPLREGAGQTLVEFALTLPILLLLLFGIIEFGRIFQAWVSLQNSARTAARFASTGQPFNDVRQTAYNLDNFVPCLVGDQRGAQVMEPPSGPASEQYVRYTGPEGFFATMFNGQDCDPGNSDHRGRRGDLVRLVLIYHEARRGAAGLQLEGSPYGASPAAITPTDVQNFIADQILRTRPRPGDYRYDQAAAPARNQIMYFDVMICSSRDLLSTASGRENVLETRRFITIIDPLIDPRAPVCILNEVPTEGTNPPAASAGMPWVDPGGAADAVTIVVSFNHPLITPISPISQTRDLVSNRTYIPMRAVRTAVNETFRAVSARSSIQGGGAIGGGFATPTASATSTASLTPTFTQTASRTSTITPTFTASPPPAFACNRLSVGNLEFFQNRAYITFRNENFEATQMTKAEVYWRTDPNNPGMYLSTMSLDSEIHWQGNDTSPPTVTNADPGWISGSERTLFGNSTGTWEGIFLNGPFNLSDALRIYDFANTTFYFDNPLSATDCAVTLNIPTPTPTNTRDPNNPIGTNTATGTPDCASNQIRIEFVSWERFGILKLQVVNNRGNVAPFTGFNINWAGLYTAPPQNLPIGQITLRQVTVGGSGPADPQTYRVWDSGAPPTSEDSQSPTITGATGLPGVTRPYNEGRWFGNYNFQPRSVTSVYLDFDGISGPLTDIGAQLADFNGSVFEIWCGQPGQGPSGPGGSSNSGLIQFNGPGGFPTSAPPTNPPPTNTPRPTFTPSITPSPGTPTRTPTPTNTRPTNTPRPTNTSTRTPTPTIPGGGGQIGNQ